MITNFSKTIVIIPTYNEQDNIAALAQAIFQVAPGISVLVVDDNSPDGTAETVRQLAAEQPHLGLLKRATDRGFGKSYIAAFQKTLADGRWENIVMMDADFSHDPEYLPEMIKLSSKFDVVIGSRYIDGGEIIGWELWRKLLSYWGNIYCKIITRLPISDFTSGFKVIRADLLKKIDFSNLDLSGYAFLIGLKYLLWREKAKIKEFPIIFKNRIGGESKISGHIIREGILAPWKMIFKK